MSVDTMDDLETVRTNMPLWKRQRQRILNCLIKSQFQNYDIFDLPTNAIRSHEKKDITHVRLEDQEAILFNHFLVACRWGKNTPYIQCVQEGDKIIWHWGSVDMDQTFEKQNQNICRWMKNCFKFGTSFFDLQLILSSLRNDKTRGPTVAIFCSLMIRYLRKHVFSQIDELDDMEGKNLLTLQRICDDMNVRILRPMRKMAKAVLQDDIVGGELINFLFVQKSQADNYHIVDLVEDIISLAVERYYQVILEWITQCTLSFDLAHEFFIWDLRKQQVVNSSEFGRHMNEIDLIELNDQPERDQRSIKFNKNISFDRAFVRIPQLIPEDFQSVSQEIYRLGKYLYIMRQQNAGLDLLSPQYSLDADTFKNKSLGEFCAQIVSLYQQCSQNILEHFKSQYDIVNFAKQLPRFFIGLYSTWIYEFAELFQVHGLYDMELDKLDSKMTALAQQAFQSAKLNENPYHRYFALKVSEFTKKGGQLELAPPEGTYPSLELHIASGDSALRLAFPAKVLEPYRKIFFHLFLLNRARYLMHTKYFLRTGIGSHQECATIFLFIRFINVYQEYICSIAENAHGEFARKLDSARNLDELVNIQLEFVHGMMEQAKLDQENEKLRQWIEMLTNKFSVYAYENQDMDFSELNRQASPIVGNIKKHLLEHRRSLNTLKSILFGCYFSAIGATANDEPLWKLLQHVDEIPSQ